ncbi:MAG: putative Ig domain-containing protein, partial [Acidobacteria bacterium]|nr:putative Ig domain-containing protein [Acidobacteriota bacterium]
MTWTPTGAVPPGLTLDSNGVLAGTPATAGFYNIEFRMSDGVDTVYRSIGVFVAAIQITSPGVLPNAEEFAPYSVTLTATGGTGVFTFTANGLPPGLTLDPNGTISGTPNFGRGKWGFNVTATDTNFTSYSKNMSIDVVGDPPTLAQLMPYGQQLDDCTIGVACTLGIGIYSGGTAPFTWTETGLPPGLWIRSGDGVTPSWVTPGDALIGGTSTAAGTFVVEVTATDALGATSTNIFPLHVSTLLETDYPPSGTVGVPYAATLRVIGGAAPYTVAMQDGSLPAGISFNPSTLQVAGTPIENGGFRVVWQANPANFGARQLTLLVTPLFQTTEYTLPSGNVNTPYSVTLTAGGAAGPFTWTLARANYLPPGLTLDPDGTLRGKPTGSGQYFFSVHAVDEAGDALIAFFNVSIYPEGVTPAVRITSGSFFSGPGLGQVDFSLSATGGDGAFTWEVISGSLPPGVSLRSDVP